MKVLVSFQPSKEMNLFEGVGLRKTIKGSLEMNNIAYTTNALDVYDVAHFVSPDEEDTVRYAKELNVPIIISALYCEDDPDASYLSYKNKDGEKIISLTPKALKFLNKGDLILVPSEMCRSFLMKEGVSTPIKISIPGVNLARFDFSRDDEKDIFYRYFREDRTKKIVLAIGDYENMDGLNAFINAAKKCPNAIFYYMGFSGSPNKVNRKVKRILKKGSKNIRFTSILPNDVYRSLLLNASILLIPGYKPVGVGTVLEAMAAKCQIIARRPTIFPEIISDGETAHIAEFSETLVALVRDFLENKIKPTTHEAYNFVSRYDLTTYGKELENIYQENIDKKKGEMIRDYDRH